MAKLIFAIIIFLAMGSEEALADIAVVVNINSETTWDSENIENEIKSIFLGKKERFSNDMPAKPVDQKEGTPIRKSFYIKLVNKDETGMKVYWSNLIFTGNGRPPKVVGNDEGVKKYISENQNAIGYINSKSVDKSVKVIYTFKN